MNKFILPITMVAVPLISLIIYGSFIFSIKEVLLGILIVGLGISFVGGCILLDNK